MVRKLILATAGSLAFCSTAFGLGLGDLQLRSNLNQTFNGTIDVRDLDGLGQDEVLVQLASPEEFARVGIDRGAYLQDFRFRVQISGGRGQIRVSSSRPVTEPFVEFLVNVAWPNGKLQRQYTALLDPPDNEVLRPSAMAPASAGPRPRRPSPNSGDEREDAVDAPRRPEAAERAPTYDRSEYGPTNRNDTLWKVAQQVRPSRNVTVRQTMLALLRLNPDAFINNNINLLKAGRTLKVPSTDQVRQTSDKQARSEVARQTREWRGVTEQPEVADAGSPVTNTPQDVPPPPQALPRDEVRIVTPPASGAAVPTPAPEAELAGSKEERDRLERELGQAGTSITALQEQNQALNNKISARDQEMAELSRKLAELEAAGPAAPEGKSAGLLSSALGKALLAAFGVVLIGALVLLNLWNKARLRAQQAEREKAATDERLERTVRMERERTGNTQRGGIPLTTPAAAVASAAASIASQRSARAPAIEPSLDLTSDGLSQTAELTNFDKTVILADPGAESRRVTQELPANDVVSEADIYIAYGRFPQAISFLQSALEKEPNRNDARLKLMEAYAETKDAAAFQLEAQQLLSRSPSEADLRRGRQLQARMPGVSAIPSEQLLEQSVDFDKTIIDTSMADQELQETLSSAAVELDLDLDRTELLSDIEGQKPLDLDLSADAISGNDERLDFDLNLDAFDEPAPGDRGDQLGGDLGLEFRDDDSFDPARTARSDAKSADDDLGLDLTLDGRARRVEPTKRAPVQQDDDQGLGLTLDSDDDVRPASRSSNLMNLDTVAGSPVDDDLADFLSDDTDEARTKLDLARAYIDMGDEDGARDILNEVLAEGSDGQKHEARELIARLS